MGFRKNRESLVPPPAESVASEAPAKPELAPEPVVLPSAPPAPAVEPELASDSEAPEVLAEDEVEVSEEEPAEEEVAPSPAPVAPSPVPTVKPTKKVKNGLKEQA